MACGLHNTMLCVLLWKKRLRLFITLVQFSCQCCSVRYKILCFAVNKHSIKHSHSSIHFRGQFSSQILRSDVESTCFAVYWGIICIFIPLFVRSTYDDNIVSSFTLGFPPLHKTSQSLISISLYWPLSGARGCYSGWHLLAPPSGPKLHHTNLWTTSYSAENKPLWLTTAFPLASSAGELSPARQQNITESTVKFCQAEVLNPHRCLISKPNWNRSSEIRQWNAYRTYINAITSCDFTLVEMIFLPAVLFVSPTISAIGQLRYVFVCQCSPKRTNNPQKHEDRFLWSWFCSKTFIDNWLFYKPT